MKRSRRQITLRVESLEAIELLSTIFGVPTTGSYTGLGNVGSNSTDAQALQQDFSGGFLEQYISQLEVVSGRKANIRQYAQAVLGDHQLTNFDLQNTAGFVGLTLPTGIALPTDVHDAEQVLAAVKGKNLDQTYLKVMRQINAQDVASDQQLIGSTSNGSVKAYATETLAYDHQLTNFDLQNTAGFVGLTLPTGIALPTDVHDAEQVLAAVKGKNLDQTYLKVMRQINAQDVASDQQLIGSTSNGSVKAYATETLAYDQNHLQGAKTLISQPKATYNPTIPTPSLVMLPIYNTTSPPPSPTPATAADAQALTKDASGGYLEQIISEVEVQDGNRSDAQQFAQTVVGDHQLTNYGLIATALASGVGFAAGVQQQSDIQDLQQILNAVRKGNVDQTYLQVMAKINAQDVAADQQLIGSTQNASILAYAQGTEAFDMMHLQSARTLLAQQTNTFPPSNN